MESRKATGLALVAFLTLEILTAQALPVKAEESQSDSSLEVASVIQRRITDEGVTEDVIEQEILEEESSPQEEEPLQPADAPAEDATQFVLAREGADPVIIKALPSWETDASVYVNDMEVVRFRADAGGMTAFDRARTVAQRLYQALANDPEAAARIRPAAIKRFAVIELDGEVLATIDRVTAKEANTSNDRLAWLWANRMREALSQPALTEEDYEKLAKAFAHDRYRTVGKFQSGEASWYGPGFHGRRTASGTRYDMYAMTAAHKTLPFGTLVRVTNRWNNKSCVVKITDRGPYAHGRIIDLSKKAAQAIGMSGVAPVTLEIVEPKS